MRYQLINDSESSFVVKHIDSNGVISFIPKDEASTDYQEYLKWTKASPKNVALPADEVD